MWAMSIGDGQSGNASWWKRYAPILGVAFAGLAVTVVIFFIFENMEMTSIEMEFRNAAELRVGAILDVINDEKVMLAAINGVFIGSEEVTRDEFRDVITMFANYRSGALSLQWLPRTSEACYPVTYVEPPDSELLGFDPYSDPVRREAMDRAMASDVAAATAPLNLKQGGRGFVVYVPVLRSKELIGFVAGVYEARLFIDRSLERMPSQGLNLEFLDLMAPEENRTLYSFDDQQGEPDWAAPLEDDLLDRLAHGHSFDNSSREWHLRIVPTLEFIREHRSWYPFGIFPIGLLFTALVAGYFRLVMGQREKVERLVEERTAQLKETQLQLIQAEKLESVGRLAAGVAHEVKNPLAIIQLGLDFLKPSAEGEAAEVVDEMDEAVGRADKVVKGLVDFSRSDKLDMERQDLNDVVEAALRMVKHELQARKISLHDKLAAGLPLLLLDKGKIEQVLINLCMNAAQAMDSKGELNVETSRIGEEVLLLVKDTGPGIPADKLDKIFDPFFTTKAVGKGTGLGLSVVRNIIELHNAAIAVQNRPQGGASFTIRFPV